MPIARLHSQFLLFFALTACATPELRPGTSSTEVRSEANAIPPESDKTAQIQARQDNAATDHTTLDDPESQSEDAAGSFDDDADEAQLTPSEDMDGEFCSDDLYTSYLKSQYRAQNPSPHGRHHHGKRADAEISALFYARRHLDGPIPPYFGAIPIEVRPRVDYWMRYFKTRGRHSFMKWLVRGESLRPLVTPLLRAEGLPQELVFLAMVESGFSNAAHSRARAQGTWQFMSSTARRYGLKINHWVDERRDPVKSTIAAARYLRDLYAEFGHWYLAMAAYNAGPGKIERAIRHCGSRDFWDLAATSNLRPETKNYVPKVLAALILASNPAANGFDVVANPEDLPPSTTVAVSRPVRLSELAERLNISEIALRSWNPELTGAIVPPARGGYRLRLPDPYAKQFPLVQTELAYLDIRDVVMHRISRGETLATIARHYRVRVKQILAVNPRLRPNRLRIGQEIAIPIPTIITAKRQTKDPV